MCADVKNTLRQVPSPNFADFFKTKGKRTEKNKEFKKSTKKKLSQVGSLLDYLQSFASALFETVRRP